MEVKPDIDIGAIYYYHFCGKLMYRENNYHWVQNMLL